MSSQKILLCWVVFLYTLGVSFWLKDFFFGPRKVVFTSSSMFVHWLFDLLSLICCLSVCVCRRPPQTLACLRPCMLSGLGSCWMTPPWKQHWRLCVSIQPTAQQVCRLVSLLSDSTSVCVCLCALCACPSPRSAVCNLTKSYAPHWESHCALQWQLNNSGYKTSAWLLTSHNGCSVGTFYY